MPRNPRSAEGGICYHLLNRSNNREPIFHKDEDYEAFLRALAHASVEVPMPVYAYCLMPNHYHLVVQPANDGDLSRWMHWLQNAHVRRYHKQNGTSGHLWQGRYKSFPIQTDEHLLAVMRYVERNPVRAKLVRASVRWAWSSAKYWGEADRPGWLAASPVEKPQDWSAWVDAAVTTTELETLRNCVNRGTPFGSEVWKATIAKQLGLESTMRKRGRPKKEAGK